MESSKPAALPNFGSLGQTVTKVFRLRRAATNSGFSTGIVPDEEIGTHNKHKLKQNHSFAGLISEPAGFDKLKQDKKQQQALQKDEESIESLVANLFASVSAIKASYRQLQIAQIPYDPDRIQSADLAIVSELKRIAELKQTYLKTQHRRQTFSESRAALCAKFNELRNLINTYQITTNKLEAETKLKDSEFLSLQAQLLDSEQRNGALEAKVHPRQSLAALEDLHVSGLNSTHFLTLLRYTFKSIRSFVNLLMKELDSAGWDLDAAASAIQSDIRRKKPKHRQYAFESYVCHKMFSDFHQKSFGIASLDDRWMWEGRQFFEEFTKLKSSKLKQNISYQSPAAEFYRAKYLTVVHPKLESSFFGDLEYRELVSSGEGFPDSPFFVEFLEMARRVWLMHCLFFSFEPASNRSIFQVRRETRFSEVYMESICAYDDDIDDFIDGNSPFTVGFTVVPGFRIGRTVIQSKVYLISGRPKSRQRS